MSRYTLERSEQVKESCKELISQQALMLATTRLNFLHNLMFFLGGGVVFCLLQAKTELKITLHNNLVCFWETLIPKLMMVCISVSFLCLWSNFFYLFFCFLCYHCVCVCVEGCTCVPRAFLYVVGTSVQDYSEL